MINSLIKSTLAINTIALGLFAFSTAEASENQAPDYAYDNSISIPSNEECGPDRALEIVNSEVSKEDSYLNQLIKKIQNRIPPSAEVQTKFETTDVLLRNSWTAINYPLEEYGLFYSDNSYLVRIHSVNSRADDDRVNYSTNIEGFLAVSIISDEHINEEGNRAKVCTVQIDNFVYADSFQILNLD